VSGTGFSIGMSVIIGSYATCTTNNISATTPTQLASGGMIINSNGTQISGIISSGLSCTWGTIVTGAGGYYRIGNLNGAAQIVVQLQLTITSALTAGTKYYITGFPLPILQAVSTVPVTCHDIYNTRVCYLDTFGRLTFTPNNNMASGNTLIFGCTYIANS